MANMESQLFFLSFFFKGVLFEDKVISQISKTSTASLKQN